MAIQWCCVGIITKTSNTATTPTIGTIHRSMQEWLSLENKKGTFSPHSVFGAKITPRREDKVFIGQNVPLPQYDSQRERVCCADAGAQ
jgi:hypothetical protein